MGHILERAREHLGEPFCSLRAQGESADPIGHATPFHNYVIVEFPMPWPRDVLEAHPDGILYHRVRDAVVRASRREEGLDEASSTHGHRALGVAPDPEWSRPGITRVWHATRPEGGPSGQIAEFEVAEYLMTSRDAVADFAEAAFNDPGRLNDFDGYRLGAAPARDFFVCTHGAVDACCGKFGYPLYHHMRQRYPQVRTWRALHFGGHRFAPTAVELPSGHTWAYLDEESVAQIVGRHGAPRAIAGNLRGWAGVTGIAQAADREALLREGWSWLATRRSARVLDHDEERGRTRVRVEFTRPDGSSGAYEATVGVARLLTEIGCGPRLGELDGRIEEYRVEAFESR